MIGEIEQVGLEENQAIADFVRAAMHLVNCSPAGQALAGSGFARAMQERDAAMVVEVSLPYGPVVILAQTGAAVEERRELVRIPFVWRPEAH